MIGILQKFIQNFMTAKLGRWDYLGWYVGRRYATFLGYSSLNLDIWDLVGTILKIYLTNFGIVDHKTGSL